MMYKKKTSARRRIAALLVLPALAAGCAVTAIPAVADVIRTFALSSTSGVSVMSDAPGAALASTSSSADNKKNDKKEVFQAVEVQAEPPGGISGLMQYLNQNIRYPEDAFLANEQGRVIVKFIVEADGSISDAQVINGVSPSLDQEALRVVKAMPKWTPAKVNGKNVASWFHLPISFKLQDNTPEKEESDNTGDQK